MKELTILFSFILLAGLPVGKSVAQDKNLDLHQVITIKSGKIRGYQQDGLVIFKGIPFAAPPVGQFRWRPPQPVVPWSGIRDALTFGPNCAQAGWGGTIAPGSSEDCLYLNVWAPSIHNANTKKPVMVWIHGGGFVGGSGSDPEIAGEQFAKDNIILVTINYRLGRLGFFAHPSLSLEFPNEPKGNYGYMDQIAALQWVRENIAAFGGDSNNVTIFGFSAGGVSVHSLMSIPSATGLFHKAICQSSGGRDGVLTGRPISKDSADVFYEISAETIGLNYAKRHGIEGNEAAALAKLRDLKVEDVVDGGQETDGPGGVRIYSGPILDGKLVVETAETAYKNGRQAKIPLLIGSNAAEIGGSFVNTADSKASLFALFGSLATEAKVAYDPKGNNDFAEVISKFNSDWVWAEPARMTARAFANSGVPVYCYQFSYVPASIREKMKYGAGHGSEVPYVFNNLQNRRGVDGVSPEDNLVGQLLHAYWVNFAKYGNPNHPGSSYWPIFSTQQEYILDIETDGSFVGKPDPRKTRLDVIEKSNNQRKLLQTRGI